MAILFVVLSVVFFLVCMRVAGRRWGEHLYRDAHMWLIAAAGATGLAGFITIAITQVKVALA